MWTRAEPGDAPLVAQLRLRFNLPTEHAKLVCVRVGQARYHGARHPTESGVRKRTLTYPEHAPRLLREGCVISDQGYKGPATPHAAGSAVVRLVSDSWTDISASGLAVGACTDSKLLRIRNRDRRRWGLCEASQDEDGKTLWAPEDIVGATQMALRADSCQPSIVLWPTLPSTDGSASDLGLHPGSPYSTVGLATPSHREQRLRAETRLPYLGHNLPVMRNLRARVHAKLAEIPHFNVLTPSFSLSHCLELLATLRR